MSFIKKIFIGFALMLLLVSVIFGVIAALSFFKTEYFTNMMSFQQARPFHVSAALFWIITAAAAGIIHYAKNSFGNGLKSPISFIVFVWPWMVTIIVIFISYCFEQYGGREYWEFPPFLNLFILLAWLAFASGFFSLFLKAGAGKPVYLWMWATGIMFFLFTFLEQNLWHISWFRQSFIREMTVQWKSNGSMVGAWNQMIYGTALYLMVKISGDESIAKTKSAYFFYFLGLTNLIFNWGHHIYNVPSAGWIRMISYSISMTEWIVVINIIQGFKHKLQETHKYNWLLTYKFLIASEGWIFLNLLLALLMSVPALNRYTHGTHVTVAHAMGTTIGINTMILLASICYILKLDDNRQKSMRLKLNIGYWVTQISLLIFWMALIIAGIIKGYQMVTKPDAVFFDIMQPAVPYLKLFMFSGFVLAAGLINIVIVLLSSLFSLTAKS